MELCQDEKAIEAVELSMSKARTKLLMGGDPKFAFFATVAMNLDVYVVDENDKDIRTAGIGHRRDLYVNPKWWLALTDPQRIGVLAHEILHVALRHHTRRQSRDPKRWNVAGDIVINDILKEQQFELPSEGVFREQFGFKEDQTTDVYYDLLEKNTKYGKLKDQADPGGCGGVIDAGGDDAKNAEAESNTDQIIRAGRMEAQKKGDVPGKLGAFLKEFGKPRIDYWDVLRPFLQSRSADDYCWARPNRRLISQGMYLPGLHSECLGKIVVMVDGSGSCWDKAVMTRFASELSGVLDTNPMEVVVLYHDIPVVKVDIINQGDNLELTPQGGGGTSHVPAFKWVEEHADDALAIIALTDLYTDFPKNPPQIPTFWISVAKNQKAPFGEVLEVDL